MRIIDQVLNRFGRREQATTPGAHVPPPLAASEKQELREAQVRIPRKWRAFDAMLADYDSTDQTLIQRRR
jgi:hypothetical protein